MDVRIHGLTKLNELQQAKITSALQKGGQVLDSFIWERKILACRFTENRGYSPKEIVELVRSGADGPKGEKDKTLDIEIEGFYSFSGTVGYSYLGRMKQYINTRFLDMYDEAEVFGHILHEVAHKSHNFVHKHRKATSIPYQIGRVSREAYREYYLVNVPSAQLSSSFNYSIVN